MGARIIALAAAAAAESFPKLAAVAGGCGCGGGGNGGGCTNCKPGSFPPGYVPPPNPSSGLPVPMMTDAMLSTVAVPTSGVPIPSMVLTNQRNGINGVPTQVVYAKVEPSSDCYSPPTPPYWDMVRDAMYMTIVAGEATIAGGASTDVVVQPTQGWFDGFYVEIYAVDAANPQSRQRVRVGRFFVGDCPGDCRTISIFSDVFEANQACCNGRPLRARFSRANDGNDLRVSITNPNAAGNVIVQVLVRGYCNRQSCAC